MINNNWFIQRFNGVKWKRNRMCYISPLFFERYTNRYTNTSGEPGLVDMLLALHAGSRGFDSHRGHMSERFFRSNRPGYPHPVSSELENSGIRVAVGDCSVTERRRWRPPYQTGKTVHVHAKHYNTTRTDTRRRVCAAMVPYRWATRGTSLRELEYTLIPIVCGWLNFHPSGL